MIIKMCLIETAFKLRETTFSLSLLRRLLSSLLLLLLLLLLCWSFLSHPLSRGFYLSFAFLFIRNFLFLKNKLITHSPTSIT